jgi:hypothetical protein
MDARPLPATIKDPDPRRAWAANRWDDDYKPVKAGAEWREHEIQVVLDLSTAQMQNLKLDVGVAFVQKFPDRTWPSNIKSRDKKTFARSLLQPVMDKWGPAFNIPTRHEVFFLVLYDLLKPLVSKRKLPKVSAVSE